MKEQSRQLLILVMITLVLCAAVVGYNAFYVPEVPLSEPVVTADSGRQSRASAVPPGGKLNLNTATADQMSDALPGVGDKTAAEIVAYRKQHGPFRSVAEIKNIKGIGEKKFSKIEPLLTVG